MSFEDRLREQFRRADASVPSERIDWSTTITKARRDRMKFAAVIAVAAVSIIGVGAYAVTQLDGGPERISVVGPSEAPAASPSTEPSSTPSEEGPRCSSSDLPGDNIALRTDGLPEEVQQTWFSIVQAAFACDYERLEALALQGREGFSYSFGIVDGTPSAFWSDRERHARRTGEKTDEYIRYLVETLALPYCEEDGPDGEHYFVWPRVHCSARTHADWKDLKGLYTPKQIDQMRTGDLYYGFRVGILEDGDWVYFIAGD